MSQNGKGSSPRNIFSANWRNGYDGIDWAETWYTNKDNVILTSMEPMDYLMPVNTVVKIRGSTVYTFGKDDKIVELNMMPSFIRNSGFFSKTKIEDEN